MRANANCWLEEMGPPLACAAILDTEPLRVRSDHCYLECSLAAVKHAYSEMDKWTFMTSAKDHQVLGYPTARDGWRERRARWAAQLIYHQDHIGGREFLELDFDGSNPNWGLALAIGHGLFDWCLQKIRKTRTNPFTVAKKRGWTVEEA